jgi:hypothetical protein
MENRNGLVVEATVTPATGTAEREAALALVEAQAPSRRITLGGDKNYNTHPLRSGVAGAAGHAACGAAYDEPG